MNFIFMAVFLLFSAFITNLYVRYKTALYMLSSTNIFFIIIINPESDREITHEWPALLKTYVPKSF